VTISRATLFAALPPERTVPLRAPRAKVVVLDDDPTGTQTVHGIPVLTEWSVASLAAELRAPGPCFYVLTNTRALDAANAEALNREIGQHLVAASRQTGIAFRVLSRSDSTLRGHYPLEIDTLTEVLGGSFDAIFLVPAFFEGGRLTINDTHYVADGDALVPAGETEFARDATFGYRSSDLRAWIEEKTGGRIPAATVLSLSLADLRGDADALANKVAGFSGGQTVIVNAAAPGDLRAFATSLAYAEDLGRTFLFRTAASFVAAYAGIEPKLLLRPDELILPGSDGGLLIVGSYVGKTSAQLEQLFAGSPIARIELDAVKILDPRQREAELSNIARNVDALLARGENVAVYTSRALVTGRDAAENLRIGKTVSLALVRLVQTLRARPRWLIAKGGITSSDIATQGLGVRRALILGQALPGVPVWRLGPEARWPGLPYVVFPGNVGSPDSLRHLIASLR
jgi:uncharacterized protein YgbK (DUF1537 family)